jgi:hypothetical protein
MKEIICRWKEKERGKKSVNYWTQFQLFALCGGYFSCVVISLDFSLTDLTNISHPYTRRKYQHVSANNTFVTDILKAMCIPDV